MTSTFIVVPFECPSQSFLERDVGFPAQLILSQGGAIAKILRGAEQAVTGKEGKAFCLCQRCLCLQEGRNQIDEAKRHVQRECFEPCPLDELAEIFSLRDLVIVDNIEDLANRLFSRPGEKNRVCNILHIGQWQEIVSGSNDQEDFIF